MKLDSNKAKPKYSCRDAWWYDERGGISVYMADGRTVMSCTISRRQLAAYFKRNKPGISPPGRTP